MFLEKYNTLLTGLASSKIYLETAYKYQDFYGEWGMTSLRFITPFLWIFPLIASSLLTISFKRQKLTGSMQKCMISLMAFDVFFAVSTGVKDAVLNALHGTMIMLSTESVSFFSFLSAFKLSFMEPHFGSNL